MRRQCAGALERLCSILTGLVFCIGCWEEIHYNPPPKSAPPEATVVKEPPRDAGAKSAESPTVPADQKAP